MSEPVLHNGLAIQIRGDLALAVNNENHNMIADRYLQTIRMVTVQMGDHDKFKIIWERWRKEENVHNCKHLLPQFEDLMDLNYYYKGWNRQ